MENPGTRIIQIFRSENPNTRASTTLVCAVIPPILIAGDAIALFGGATIQPVHYIIYALATGLNLYGIANGNWSSKRDGE